MKIQLTLILICLSINVIARPFSLNNNNVPTLQERLKLAEANGTTTSYLCWESLFELRSCTGEMVTFFLNGETYLGAECCRAVRTIQQHCWPSLLGSLGYTTEETDVLYGYCAADQQGETIPLPPPPPPSAAAVNGGDRKGRGFYFYP